MRITVFGSGYVGLVTGACLADAGNHVVCVDVDQSDPGKVKAQIRELLDKGVETLAARITPRGALWLAWPRRAGGHLGDITDNEVRRIVLPLGLVDTKVAALDDDWSGLKFVWRKERRGSLG